MSFFDGLVCAVFGHRWIEWRYERSGECGQLRTCTRDGAVQRRGPVHVWGAWQDDARKCTRCQAVDTKPGQDSDACACEDMGYLCGMGCDPG